MTRDDFIMWLHGFFELSESDNGLTQRQVEIIQDHLSLLFNKVTPDRPKQPVEDFNKSIQDAIRDLDWPQIPSWKEPVLGWPQFTPVWEIDKHTYNPNYKLSPSITC